jgi:hypothetical protein
MTTMAHEKEIDTAQYPHLRGHLAELRAFLTPALREHFEALQNPRLIDVFVLLRRLRPDDVRTAMLCHRVLLDEARGDMRRMGFMDDQWADLPRLVFNVLGAQGCHFYPSSGRWG